MRDFLNEFLIKPFHRLNNWFDRCMGVFCWLIFFTIISGTLLLFAWTIDSSFLPVNEGKAVVTGKAYNRPYMFYNTVQVGNQSIPTPVHVQANYELTMEIDGLTGNVLINEISWDRIKKGDKICCKFQKGRFFKTLYIVELFNF